MKSAIAFLGLLAWAVCGDGRAGSAANPSEVTVPQPGDAGVPTPEPTPPRARLFLGGAFIDYGETYSSYAFDVALNGFVLTDRAQRLPLSSASAAWVDVAPGRYTIEIRDLDGATLATAPELDLVAGTWNEIEVYGPPDHTQCFVKADVMPPAGTVRVRVGNAFPDETIDVVRCAGESCTPLRAGLGYGETWDADLEPAEGADVRAVRAHPPDGYPVPDVIGRPAPLDIGGVYFSIFPAWQERVPDEVCPFCSVAGGVSLTTYATVPGFWATRLPPSP